MGLTDTVYVQLVHMWDGFDVYKLLRLVIVVGGYMLIRTLVQRDLAKRQLKRQLEQDKLRKEGAPATEPAMESAKGPAAASSSSSELSQFGWGNKTRVRVKQQQELLASAIDKLREGQFDSQRDDDIADLLED
ncbi:Pga2p KNAG_0I02360 [Huiozyma naganishii CBS 8797]|uniref:Processing of GAS1 and ALP protein 2 n=1 Tax=Huiozyma naganishii (strain ATCC MYA-139 / BCRC 22969 / CBS 8797 / KCTC 17520 / NBRC 10181 / NCYC 3082 / Yp74L-3) TaxID=1071383 RepID=J7S2H6_HUIN7|nr:hypothetical protein KNAG_0I02360 [Kazachstania naganishii CBS 8797]CCK72022.1 hypothetical protein KNAG_0I02360 [Kazachstania naganishii CBS 8797]